MMFDGNTLKEDERSKREVAMGSRIKLLGVKPIYGKVVQMYVSVLPLQICKQEGTTKIDQMYENG